MNRVVIGAALALLAAAAVGEAEARVKLITLPVRDRVEIRLDHLRATLVEEERTVPFTRGENAVDFAWANTSIDPESIVFRVLGSDEPNAPKVLSVSYPPGERALVWTVYAPQARAVRVRISYLLSGLSRSVNYRAVASHDESELSLSQYLRVINRANEAFPGSVLWLSDDKRLDRPLELNETREVLVQQWSGLPVNKTYTADLGKYGWLDSARQQVRVAMHYVIENVTARGLGGDALARGKARIYQDDGNGGTVFLGEDWGKRTPPGDEMPLYLGLARDVVVKRSVHANARRRTAGNLFDQYVTLRYEIENFKDREVTVDLVEDIFRLRTELLGSKAHPLEWTLGEGTDFAGGIDTKRSGAGRAVVHAVLPGVGQGTGRQAEKIVRHLQIVMRNEW